MGGEAADQLVRLMLSGTEVTIRLTGSAARSLASVLIAWSRNEMKVYGKTNMMRLLKSGDKLYVLQLDASQYSSFEKLAKKSVLYAPFRNMKKQDDKVIIVISEKSREVVNHILNEIGFTDDRPVAEREGGDPDKKKVAPFVEDFTDTGKDSLFQRMRENQERKAAMSVRDRLFAYRQFTDRTAEGVRDAAEKTADAVTHGGPQI